jgi:hypothetical protein
MVVREERAADFAARRNRALKIPQKSIYDEQDKVGDNNQKYASKKPLSEFQREVRYGTKNDVVLNHYTMKWKDEVMERILRIPMKPNANHMDIPAEW